MLVCFFSFFFRWFILSFILFSLISVFFLALLSFFFKCFHSSFNSFLLYFLFFCVLPFSPIFTWSKVNSYYIHFQVLQPYSHIFHDGHFIFYSRNWLFIPFSLVHPNDKNIEHMLKSPFISTPLIVLPILFQPGHLQKKKIYFNNNLILRVYSDALSDRP